MTQPTLNNAPTMEIAVKGTFSAANRLQGYEFEGRPDQMHGHNFVVTAVYRIPANNTDPPHRDTLQGDLDAVIARFDHKNLLDDPAFKGIPTSVENTTRFIYEQLKPNGPYLARVVVQETGTQSATYFEA